MASGRAVGVVAVVAGAGVLVAAPAWAHVQVEADDVRRGASSSVLRFAVPGEERDAATVRVTIRMPRRAPLAVVEPAAKKGWTVTTARVVFPEPVTGPSGPVTSGVGDVTYTASAATARAGVGADVTFTVRVGPLPRDAASLTFPVAQTYSNGRTAAWSQPQLPGADEPEYPAPLLMLAGTAPVPPSPSATASTSPSSTSSSLVSTSPGAPSATGQVVSPSTTASTSSAAATTSAPTATGSTTGSGGAWWRDQWVWAAGLAGTAAGVGLVRLSRSGWAARLGSSGDDAGEDR